MPIKKNLHVRIICLRAGVGIILMVAGVTKRMSRLQVMYVVAESIDPILPI